MYFFPMFLIIIFSLFSTATMTYIAMATPIGPWMAPTVALLATIIFKAVTHSKKDMTPSIALSAIGGSVGGILATAFGFSFPTLYFLDPHLFTELLQTPLYFIALVSALGFAAGSLGFLVADVAEKKLLVDDNLPFPIGAITYKMIAIQHNVRKAWELVAGFVSTVLFCAMQGTVIPVSARVFSGFQWSVFAVPALAVRFDQLPMFWAIGFISGHLIAKPLALGALAKILIVDPLNALYFPALSSEDFLMAFCSGIVLVSAGSSFIALPGMLKRGLSILRQQRIAAAGTFTNMRGVVSFPELAIALVGVVGFLTYLKFSVLTQLYLIVLSAICAYQVAAIAGKIGLALIGRFATFVMVPAYILFGLSFTQLVIVATFVEMSGGVATDILFGRKTAQLANIPRTQAKIAQWLGLAVSSVALGCVAWLLITHFGLGSPELVAQRSQARALLLNFSSFNYSVLLVGAIFGYCIEKLCKVSPMLLLGGLLMSLNYSLLLIAGGLSSQLVKNREDWEPFWSGVYTGNSLWIVARAFFQ